MSGFNVDNPPLTDESDMPDITEGDDVDFEMSFTDENDSALDISDWTVWITVKENYSDDDPAALIQKSTTSHDDPTGGVTTLTFTTSDTQDLSGTKVWDLQVDTGSKVHTINRGTVRFVPEVTRA